MTPQEEAKRLIDKYMKVIKERTDVWIAYSYLSFAKDCADMCAERCEELAYAIPISDATFSHRKEQLEFWKQVRKSIAGTTQYNNP